MSHIYSLFSTSWARKFYIVDKYVAVSLYAASPSAGENEKR